MNKSVKIDELARRILVNMTTPYGAIKELAEKIHVHPRTIKSWATGKVTKISKEKWELLAKEMQKFMAEALPPDLQSLREFQIYVHKNAVDKGWWEEPVEKGTNMMLMVSEIAEAMEADRAGNPPDDKIPAFSGIEAELADTVIRILDFAAGHNYDVIGAMEAKAQFNKTRTYKHGGKRY
jgi:NTP pyrophosphatase (non-canonical NTP hydrolase)